MQARKVSAFWLLTWEKPGGTPEEWLETVVGKVQEGFPLKWGKTKFHNFMEKERVHVVRFVAMTHFMGVLSGRVAVQFNKALPMGALRKNYYRGPLAPLDVSKFYIQVHGGLALACLDQDMAKAAAWPPGAWGDFLAWVDRREKEMGDRYTNIDRDIDCRLVEDFEDFLYKEKEIKKEDK